MQSAGMLVTIHGQMASLEKSPPIASRIREYIGQSDNTFLFGFCGDNHIGSKYSRLDVLHDLYAKFTYEGVDRVFNCGNWIDGEARFNLHDLLVHGMDNQLRELIQQYPAYNVDTYAIAGDDHEGWYCQREGIDIGQHAEQSMRAAGRSDWHNLGYLEAYVNLTNANSGKSAKLLIMHPGGGSSYAHSYKPQKIVESFEGGEKPAVLLIGHYHKLSFNVVRNVYAIQAGCTQDQTLFMRKKSIEAHVGGGICRLTQDARTGAITSCRVEIFNYFNAGYYNQRWSNSGDVTLPPRR
jgi:predicted phosphodiesterase